MDEDKIFELAEILADKAFGNKGRYLYSERQELTSKFNEMLLYFLKSKIYTYQDMEKCWEQAQLSTVLHEVQDGYLTFEEFIKTLAKGDPKTEDTSA